MGLVERFLTYVQMTAIFSSGKSIYKTPFLEFLNLILPCADAFMHYPPPMTASSEQEKHHYSRQLAAHTLQQLILVRQRAEDKPRTEIPSSSAESQKDEGENQGVAFRDRENSPNGETTPRGKQKSVGNKSRKSR